jgi:transposase-like protein
VGRARRCVPHAREQRCWAHKTANVLDALPERVHQLAKRLLLEVERAATRQDANRVIDEFVAEFEPKWPKAAEKVVKDRHELLAFYDFPAEHWRHLRTTNPSQRATRRSDVQGRHQGHRRRHHDEREGRRLMILHPLIHNT